MLICPDCGAENIDGADVCEACNQSLTDLSTRMPTAGVEAGLVRDRVSMIPNHPPVAVRPSTTVGEVLDAMTSQRIGCVLVTPTEACDTLLGIFTERDALMRLNVKAPQCLAMAIQEFMTPNPATIRAGDKIAYALHKMNHGGYRHLPVMEGDKPMSVMSVRDVLRYLTQRGA